MKAISSPMRCAWLGAFALMAGFPHCSLASAIRATRVFSVGGSSSAVGDSDHVRVYRLSGPSLAKTKDG
jgi:hypothetical protein